MRVRGCFDDLDSGDYLGDVAVRIGQAIAIAARRLSRLQTSTEGTPASFLWKAATGAESAVECVTNSYTRRTVLEVGGFQVEADCRILVLKERFLTVDSTLVTIDSELFTMDGDKPRPVAGKRLTLNGQKLRIEATQDPLPADTKGFWWLICIDPSK